MREEGGGVTTGGATLAASSGSGGSNRRSGRRGKLLSSASEAELAVFREVWSHICQRGLRVHDGCAIGEDPESMVIRFLRANQCNATKCLQMLEDDLHWRCSNEIAELRIMKPEDILGCKLSDLLRYYPHGHVGFDKEGRPVLVQRYGGFEVWNIKKLTTLEAVVRYHIWEQEMNCALLASQAEALGRAVDGFCMIIDIGDMSMNKVTREFLWLVQRLCEVDQKHYPERLGVMYIVNTPGVFPLVWKGIKPWLDVRTTNKIKIFSKPELWQPELLNAIEPAQLPIEYGGTGPPLTSRSRELKLPALPSYEPRPSSRGFEAGTIQRLIRGVGQGPASEAGSEEDRYEDAIMLDIDLYTRGEDFNRSLDQDFLRTLMLNMQSLHGGPQTPVALTHLMERGDIKELNTIPEETGEGATSAVRELWSDQLAAVLERAPTLCGPCRGLLGWDVPRLQRNIERANLVCLFFGVMIIAFGVNVLASMAWIGDLLVVMMWLAVVIVSMGCCLLLLSLVGYLGTRYGNRLMLNIYILSMLPSSIFMLILAFTCFAASSPRDSTLFKATWLQIESHYDNHANQLESIRRSIEHDNVMLGAGCLCVSSLNFIPCLLGILLSSKLKHHRQPMNADASHLRVVTRVANAVTCSFGLVCIAYGGYATNYSMTHHFNQHVFTPFILMEAGIVLIIVSGIGFWTASSRSHTVMTIYTCILLPLFAALVGLGAQNYKNIGGVSDAVHRRYDTTQTLPVGVTIQEIISWTKASLVVVGTLELVTGVFQLVSLVHVILLKESIKARVDRYSAFHFHPLLLYERVMVAWGILAGLTYIFCDGTFVVFSTWLSQQKVTGDGAWWLHVYEWIGKTDRRYLDGETFLVASGGLLATIIGPGCLFFAWSMANRKGYRLLLGMVLCSVLSYTQLIYYASAIENPQNIVLRNPSSFWVYFVLISLLKLVVPLAILAFLFHKSHRKLVRLRDYETAAAITRLAGARMLSGDVGWHEETAIPRSLVDKASIDRQEEVMIKMMSASELGGCMDLGVGGQRGPDSSSIVQSISKRD